MALRKKTANRKKTTNRKKSGGTRKLKTMKNKQTRKTNSVRISPLAVSTEADTDKLVNELINEFSGINLQKNRKPRRRKSPSDITMATRRSTRKRTQSRRTQHGIAQSWEAIKPKIINDYSKRIRPENPTLDEIKSILVREGVTVDISDEQLMKKYVIPLNIIITNLWIELHPSDLFKSFADDMLEALEALDI